MKSLVLEVQTAAMDDNVSLASVLRKAKVLTAQLELTDIDDWLALESSGYTDNFEIDQLPNHRVPRGRPVYYNPYSGFCTLVATGFTDQVMLSTAEIRDSVASIESNIESLKALGKASAYVPYSPAMAHLIQQFSDLQGMTPYVQISRGGLVAVLEGVRNRILDWTILLKRQGEIGDGMTFSTEDKERATVASKTVINKYTTTIHGNVQNSQLQQASDNSEQTQTNIDYDKVKSIADKVKENINKFGIDDEDIIVELNGHLDTVNENLRTTTPDFEIVAPAMRSVKAILEGATGNLLASQLISQIPTILL